MARLTSRDDPILIDDDDTILNGVERLIGYRDAFGNQPRRAQTIKEELVPDDFEIKLEESLELEGDLGNFVDLTIEDATPLRRRPVSTLPRRNPLLEEHQTPLQTAWHQGVELKEDQMVEVLGLETLPKSLKRFAPDFFYIKFIVQNTNTGVLTLRALPFTRTRKLKGLLPPKKNEIAMLLEIDRDDERDISEQCLVEIELKDDIHCVHRDFWRSSRPFPEDRCSRLDENQGSLVCRWKYSIYYRNAGMRKAGTANEWTLQHLRYKEADPGHRLADEMCRFRWRKLTKRGGSFDPNDQSLPAIEISDDTPAIDLLDDDNASLPPLRANAGQRYTIGDIFAGAGGASRGIKRAGFHLTFGVDYWRAACDSYELNFPEVPLYCMDVHDFILNDVGQYCVDGLHLSPPCQTWSPAHTTPGKNDETNAACLFSCTDLIKKLKPRIFTLEQTFGLIHPRFEIYRNALTQGFTAHGYSVSWKIVHLVSWGLPQTRKRFIMIGSCHGEALPSFPETTHGDSDGLMPFTTVRETLNRIGPTSTLHDPHLMKKIYKLPYDPDKPLARTITCSGGQTYYYDGKRNFTKRELASLNGFPTFHQFHGPDIKRQIGNAFPPSMVKVLYDHLLRHLKREDNIQGELAGDESEDLVFVSGTSRLPREVSPPPAKKEDVKDVKLARTSAWVGAEPMVIEDDDDEVRDQARQPVEEDDESSYTLGRSEIDRFDIGSSGVQDVTLEEMEDEIMEIDGLDTGSSTSPEPIPSPATGVDEPSEDTSCISKQSVSVASAIRGQTACVPIDLTDDTEMIDLT